MTTQVVAAGGTPLPGPDLAGSGAAVPLVGADSPTRGWHVTALDNLAAIRRDGLIPRMGPRSRVVGEVAPAIYLFPTLAAVEDGVANWLGEQLGDLPIVVLEVDISGLAVTRNAFELECKVPISASRLGTARLA